MQLNLKALLALRAVMTEGTVTGAAQRLHRTQPVVSRLIAQLESSLGFALFRRERQRLVPTTEGIAFYHETERAIAALAEIETNARQIRDRRPAPLRILAQSHIAHGLLNEAIANYSATHPEFQFSVEIRQREYISHWIANQQFDVGFAPAPVEHPQVESTLLIRTPLLVVLPRRHRLAGEPRLSAAKLANEPLIAVRPGIPMRARMDALFAAHGSIPAIRGETASVLLACQLVARGLGITFADPFVAGLFVKDCSVVIRPLQPGPAVDYVVLRRSGEEQSTLTNEFIECVRTTAQALIARVELHSNINVAA
jgi:DNA-binding transcriptional LysR family regulator